MSPALSDSLLDTLVGGVLQPGWGTVLVYLLIATQLTIFSVTLYLHRCAAHRGVDFHPVIAHFFRFWTWLTTSMITREWAAIHRKHHAKCETEEDPHSPMIKGIGTVFWRGAELYREARRDRASIEQYGKGLPDDWIERHVYTPRATLGPTLLLFVLFGLFGAKGVAVWALQMCWIPFWAAGVVNGLGHWWGYRNFETDDRATNISPWGLIIAGEELHNNHHAFPSSARFALRRFEFDIGWVALRMMSALGLAKILRVAPKLDIRPNIQMPDTDTVRAVLAHRFQVMTDYFRMVVVPSLREDMAGAEAKWKALPGRLRRALKDHGRWLKPEQQQRLDSWINEHPRIATVFDYRQRLRAVFERTSQGSEATLEALHQWCVEAEQSGIRALQEFSARLKGYSLQPARI